ncbi:hypothetical protein ACFLS4_03810 [Bacteroidota bacterium]
MENNPVFWALIGVAVGALLTGIINYLLQLSQFKHNKEMFFIQNQTKEKVKEILVELLNHLKYTDRTFVALKKRVGGHSDDEIRKILHELGAKKSTNKKGEESWYLKEREAERIANIKARSK